jgi:DNA repair and recombination RAD54-like protein
MHHQQSAYIYSKHTSSNVIQLQLPPLLPTQKPPQLHQPQQTQPVQPAQPTQPHNLLCHLQALRKKLLARKIFVPWGSNKPFTPLKLPAPPPPDAAADALQQELLAAADALQQELLAAAAAAAAEDAALPPGIEPLVLWDPVEAGLAADAGEHAVTVDNMLTRWLRPHQREGVQFMFECVTGLRLAEGRGGCCSCFGSQVCVVQAGVFGEQYS